MAELKHRIRTDLTAAMKARDTERSGTLRMLIAAITNAEVAGERPKELSDDEVVAVLASESKKRREAAEAFAGGSRDELAAKERREAEMITEYLPEQLDADGIAAIVAEAVEQAGAAGQGMRAMGQVMGIVQPRVKGRADGAAVAAEVRRQLGA